ncbi:hypothetical protein WUBG_02146 [Wuchereria bancrofti]|uniref:F-box domain-containing protein n=1 Tax=Wuchereria bancrofti TaxID=6293 RepID=J9EWF4_WUCBA|nr:hypothetical protein WUBG_02146 [Wuchereria bancrofti]VDM12260.1 unnamed protein product [Wuchereria bancrofti]
MKYMLIRENVNVLDLPDEIIEQICSYISPVQLCLSGWDKISKGFKDMLQQIYKSCRILDTITGQDYRFFEQFCLLQAYEDKILIRKLEIVIRNIFPHLTMLTVSAGTLCAVLRCAVKFESIFLIPKLRFLHILLGDKCGVLTNNHILSDFIAARMFVNELKFVELSVTLSPDSEKFITCCSFRNLLRFLMEITGNTGTWSLCLKDKTKQSQGWFSPSELSSYRVTAFIAYVRIVLELGISLHTLRLVDELKMSLYMMVMKKRQRFLYMYNEYKQCKNLIICYDIGIIAPLFPPVNEKYYQLQQVEIISSHVLYKDEFLKYLSLASNIKVVRILLPCHWTERMERCAFGYFLNADFTCFMKYGWASLSHYIPHASLVFS